MSLISKRAAGSSNAENPAAPAPSLNNNKPAGAAGKASASQRGRAFGDITNVNKEHAPDVGCKRITRAEAAAAAAAAAEKEKAAAAAAAAEKEKEVVAPAAAPLRPVTRRSAAARSAAAAPTGVVPSARAPTNIDERDVLEPLAVMEYVEELYAHLRQQECDTQITSTSLEHQPHINERMRAILVDWLVEVHLRFRLVPDTLYLTVYLIDKYLESTTVTRQSLQLVGVTALLMAAKYEEIYPPEIQDLVYMTDKAYTKEQILEMEQTMLNALEFKLTVPTIYCFLLRYLKAAHADRRIVQLSCFVAERMLQEHSMLKYLPSVVACSAIYLARKNLKRNPWSPTLEKYTFYQVNDLMSCLEETCAIMSASSDLKAVKAKFSSKQFGAVAAMEITWTP